MMSLETIRDNDWYNAYKAYIEGLEPLTFTHSEDINYVGEEMVQMGSYVPDGWTLTHRLFVDKGYGGHAMSIDALKKFLKNLWVLDKNFGVALTREGQFQIHVDVYFRKPVIKNLWDWIQHNWGWTGKRILGFRIPDFYTLKLHRREFLSLVASDLNAYEVEDDFLTAEDFAPEKIREWDCEDCGEPCACPVDDKYQTCHECGLTLEADDE